MPFPRITMKDIARKLGVHTTTVSLALRNSPRLPAATREKIHALAKKMGYHQDPMLSALTAYRASLAAPRAQPTLAIVFDFKSARELEVAPESYAQFLAGATAKAEELGYKLAPFFFEGRSRATEGARIGHILLSRGIKGIILCAFRPRTDSFALDWNQFSAVQIECQHLSLPLHLISTDQTQMARGAVRRLVQAGYTRLGITVGREEEIYLDHAFTVGFHGEVALHPQLIPAPPLLLVNGQSPEECGPLLQRWIKRYNLEAVISNWPTVQRSLGTAGSGKPGDPILLRLGQTPDRSPFGHMSQRDPVVGERAVEQLAMLLKTNQTGCIDTPNRILVPGYWVEGTGKNATRTTPQART